MTMRTVSVGLMMMVAVCALARPVAIWAAPKDGPPSTSGAKLYEQFCSGCHDHPTDRVPTREVIAKHTPDEVMQILISGPMRTQAAGLNMNDRVAVATFLTGKAPGGSGVLPPETNSCPRDVSPVGKPDSADGWNGWGRDLNNSRYQPNPGITPTDVPHLKVKWAFGYRATYIYGQPTIAGGRLYVTSSTGRVYSLDAKTGCTHWMFDAAAAVRTAVSVVTIQSASGKQLATVFGDD